MKLRPNQLKIGKKYFLIDYSKDVVVEGLFYNHDLRKGIEGYSFKQSLGVQDYEVTYSVDLQLLDGVLKETVGNGGYQTWIENPIFSTREEAEAKKNKYILKSLRKVRKLILKEFKENSGQINKIKGVKCKN